MIESMKKDNIVLCPVCGKEQFDKNDCFVFCNQCGWEGNINIDDNMVELNGMSTKDYRKVYQEYIKEHPNYIWKKDKEALEKYMDSFRYNDSICPVCGENSFEPDYRYCYKCGWKYNFVQAEFPDYDCSSNKLSLNEYKNNYNQLLKNNPNYMWKNTDEIKIIFTEDQFKWLEDNNINIDINKLTPEEEIHRVYDSIEKIQKQYENKEGYETYLFIKTILDIILDNI